MSLEKNCLFRSVMILGDESMAGSILENIQGISGVVKVEHSIMRVGLDPIRREPRPSDCFVYVRTGCTRYIFNGQTIKTAPNGIMYIPRGSTYIMRIPEVYEVWYVDFYFTQENNRGVFVADMDETASSFETMLRCWNRGNEIGRVQIMSCLYRIYAEMLQRSQEAYISSDNRARVAKAVEFMRQGLSDYELDLERVAEYAGMSPSGMRRLFHSVYGIAPGQFLRLQRILEAKRMLNETDKSIREIAEECGFVNSFYFSRVFRESTGITPSEYRRGSVT